MKYLVLFSILLLSFALKAQETPVAQDGPVKLENPGFEDGAKGWTVSEKEPMATFVAEAAKKGKLGLRISDQSSESGVSVMSARLTVKPESKVKIEFWAKTTNEKFITVSLAYFSSDKAWTTDANEKLPTVTLVDVTGKWKKYELEATIPPYVNQVSVWVHTWAESKGTADFDDFEFKAK